MHVVVGLQMPASEPSALPCPSPGASTQLPNCSSPQVFPACRPGATLFLAPAQRPPPPPQCDPYLTAILIAYGFSPLPSPIRAS